MSCREGISRYCVLLKAVPDNVDGNTIRASLKNVKKSYRYNEFRSNVEVRWIVQFHKEEDASCILRQTSITLSLFSGGTVTVSVGKCPEDIIPEEWLDDADLTWSKTNHKREPSSVDHTFSNNGSLSSNTQSEPVNGQDQSQRECGSPDVFDWGTSGLTTSSERNGETSSLVDGPNPTNQSGPSYLPKNTHSGDFTVYQNAETFIIRTEALQEPINEVPPKLPERKPHPKSSHSSSTSASAPQGGKVEPSTEASLSRPGFPVSGQQVGHSVPPREEVISSLQYGKYNESFVTAQENFDSSRISDCLPEAPGDRGHFGMGQGPPDQPPYPFQPQQFGANVMVCPPGPMPQPPNFASGPMPSLPNYHYGMGMYPPYGQAPLRPPFEGAYPTPQGIFPEPGQLRSSGDWNPASFPPYNPPQHHPQPAPPTVPAENLTDPKSIVLSVSPVPDSEGQAKGVPPKRSPKSATRSKKTEKKKEKKEKGAPADEALADLSQHIQVTWVGTVSEDGLTCFFENKNRSGGGEIEEIDIDHKSKEAVIKFESSKVAKRVLEKAKSHKIGKAEVQIFAFNPEKENFFEEKVLLVTGLKDTTTTECLENYLEARCDDNLEEILYGDEGGKAVVVFEKAPDFKKLITAIKGKSLEGQKLEASRVKRCHSVCVCGIDGNITDDCLELFFENKRRSGGGQVERLDLQYDIGICIVFFKNSSDADNVWRNHRSVTVSGLSLQVKPYYPCLGLPRELAQVTIEKGSTPQIMIKDLSSYVVRFLSTSKSLKGKFDEDLKGHNAKVIWSGAKDADSMDIHCTYQVGTKLSKNTLEKWKVEAEKIVRQFLDDFTAKKLQSSSDAWKSLIEFLRTVSIDEPDKVGVILEKEQCCVVVVGWKDNVEKLGKVIQNNIKTREEKIVAKKSHVTKSCSLQPHQVMILERLQFHKNTAKSFTDVEVKMNASEKTVTFTGPKSELDKAVLKMHEILNSLTTKSFSVSQVFIELLDKEEAQKAVHDTLKSRKLQSAWVTKPKETSVEVYGVNPSEINQAMSAIRDTLPEKNFDLKDNLREFLRSEEWRGCVKKLTSHYNGKMAIVSSDQLVSFAAITDIFNSASEEIQNQVEEFTRKHCSASDFLATNSGRMKFITTHMEQELTRITKKFESGNVNISPRIMGRGKTGFVINGDKNGVKKAKKELEDMVKSIMEEKHKISEPGCVRFFGSEEGIKARQKVESDNKCIIKNTKEDSEEQTVKRGGEKSGKGANFKRPEEVASCSSGGMTMKVMEGDMTQLSVDGIVNAANNDLDHCGGLAKVISDAGGPSIQKECDKYIKKYGKVSDGDAMYSSPGQLLCKWLIHAVGPRWSGGHRNEEIDLRKAITKCLELASEKNMTSLAIPALSAGIFGYPVDQATSVIIGTIVFYFKTREGKESSLKEIYLCGVDDKIIRSFIQSLQNMLGFKSVTVKRREGASYKEERDSSPRRERSYSPKRKDEGKSYKRQGIEVRLIKGELASQKADALVNSAHHSLDLSIGATSKSLLRVGGDKVQEECKLKYRSGIKPGQVAITKGGDLQCSQVYHGTLQKFTRDNYEQAMQTMEDFVGKCLETADTNQLKSIAFPALGTGQLGYPADLVAGTMYRCISQFEKDNPSTSLVEVQLVVYHKDTATIKAFEIKSKSRSTGVTDDDSERQRSAPTRGYQDRGRSSQGASSGRSSTVGKLEVKILQGNITTDGSDAIVNSVGERMDLSKGALSKAILKEGGYKIQEECKSKVEDMRRDGLVVTAAGKLRSKYIIHVKVQRDQDSWKRTIAKALEVADTKQCRSLAFPALGTGGQGCTPEDVARAMFRAIQSFSPRSLQEVNVVVYQEDMVDSFKQAMDSTTDGETKRVKRTSKTFGRDEVQYKESKPQQSDEVVFLLWSDKSKDLKRATKDLDEIVRRECCQEKIKREALVKKLNDKQKSHITSVGRQNGVVININTSKGEIVLQGQERDVTRSKADILELLSDIDKHMNEYDKAEAMCKYVQWQFKDGSKWKNTNPMMNMYIEEAHQAKKARVTVKDRSGEEYEIDLKKNEEYEKKNPSKKYEIRRSDVGSRGTNVVGLPERWDPGQDIKEVELKPGSGEYKKVMEEFTKKGGPNTVKKIYRVQNPHLYQQYAAKRKSILERNGKNPERWLWHGTSADTIKFIINNGFNRSYCGKNGTAFGNGVYFAVDSSYSVGYCTVDQHGCNHMFSAQVLVGETCKGHGGMTVLPPKPGGKEFETYDSASNNPSSPSMYIIFHDSQAYPTYHIVF